jgi:hypothetical protein
MTSEFMGDAAARAERDAWLLLPNNPPHADGAPAPRSRSARRPAAHPEVVRPSKVAEC